MAVSVSDLTIHVDTGRWRETVVSGASFDLPAGTVTAVIGESGAGKSMLAAALAGALPEPVSVVAGTISARDVAYVPQDGRLAFDAGQPVGDQLDAVGHRGDVDGIGDLLRYPGSQRHLLPAEHSAGQIQRAAMTAAIAKRAGLLVIDEPSSSLDVTTALAVWAAIRDYPQRVLDASVLVVTHDIGLMTTTRAVDRVVAMRDGRVVADGTIDEVRRGASNYLRGFFESDAGR